MDRNNNIMKSKEIYNVWKDDDKYYISVEVINGRMDIVKAVYFYGEEGCCECYTKLRYTKQIYDTNNILGEMNVFVDKKLDKIKSKIKSTVELLNDKYGGDIPLNV